MAANVSAVTIDARRARVGCDAKIVVTTDGPLKVAIGGCDLVADAAKGTSTVGCAPRSGLVVRFPHQVAGRRVRSARVAVAGQRADRTRQHAMRVSFAGVDADRVLVKIALDLDNGRTLRQDRHYRICGAS